MGGAQGADTHNETERLLLVCLAPFQRNQENRHQKYVLCCERGGRGGPAYETQEGGNPKKKRLKTRRTTPAKGCASAEVTSIFLRISRTRYSEPSSEDATGRLWESFISLIHRRTRGRGKDGDAAETKETEHQAIKV